jgi:hypothetical protein
MTITPSERPSTVAAESGFVFGLVRGIAEPAVPVLGGSCIESVGVTRFNCLPAVIPTNPCPAISNPGFDDPCPMTL